MHIFYFNSDKNNLYLLLLFFLAIIFISPTIYAAQKTITIGVHPWAENVAVSHVWKQLLEKHGYHVKLVRANQSITWEAVSKGDMDLDFEAWLPYTDKMKYNRLKDKLILIGPWFNKAWQGLAVPDYVHIKSISGLKKYAKKFLYRGEKPIYCAEPGTVVTKHAKKAIKLYNLPFTAIVSSEPAVLAQLKSFYKKSRPIVLTLWIPHWAWAQYHLHMLKDPKHAFTKPNHIYIVAHKGFRKSFPKISEWFSNFHLTQNELDTLINTIRQASSPSAGASQWLKQHRQIWRQWFQSMSS
jgi:glycine betaine/proline transport system substrate-binding protein